jgi:glycerophosphoryl diester phosphodiesterase
MTRWPTLDGRPPLVIAHRGASGDLPEHTLAAYALALTQGADLIEPDLVPSADGVLFCRHEPGLARSTDVSRRREFASRVIAGDWPITGWSAIELERLHAIQPFPGRSPQHDGLHPLPRFCDALAWAAQAAAHRGTPVVLYPEIKHPLELAATGVDPVPLFIEAARRLPAGVELRVQCFVAAPLLRIHQATGLPCTLLLDRHDDWREALRAHGRWLAALGVNKHLLPSHGGEDGLLDSAHARGVRVDAWTFRDDQVAAGFTTIADELAAVMQAGVDGIFCDFPATALALRDALATAATAG